MLRPLSLLVAILIACASMAIASVTPEPPTIPDTPVGKQLDWLLGVFSGEEIGDPTDRFDPEFLKQFPPGLPEPVAASALGMLRDGVFRGEPARLLAIEANASETTLSAKLENANGERFVLHLSVNDTTGRLNGLLLSPDTSIAAQGLDSWGKIGAEIDSLPGRTSVLIARVIDPKTGTLEPVYQSDPQRRLAIGSAFKLWVLGGLADLILEGEASWGEPLALDPDIRTMPIGELQLRANREGKEDGAAFALREFADVMISVSDNPATDHLIERVGRDRIIDFMSRVHNEPSINQPFLTTGEFFKLKRGAPQEVLDAYIASTSPEERAAVLESAKFRDAEISIPMAIAWPKDGPIAIDAVEWFASARELAATMLELRRLEQHDGMEPLAHALRINDGINLSDETWPSVAYKGGSEPGVINLTFFAEHRSGDLYFVSLGWNDPEAMLDENRLIRLAISVFALIDSEQAAVPAKNATPDAE